MTIKLLFQEIQIAFINLITLICTKLNISGQDQNNISGQDIIQAAAGWHRRLMLSSCSIFLTIPFYFIFSQNLTIFKNCLVFMLFINFVLSITFWNNPVKNSFIHRVDAFLAKVSFVLITSYVFNSYALIFITIALVFFFIGNYYSSKQWLSNNHILYHGLFHIIGSIGICFALY